MVNHLHLVIKEQKEPISQAIKKIATSYTYHFALLYLGVKNLHLGQTLPAFLFPNVAKVLVEKFDIAGITDVKNDLKIFLGE